MKSLLPLVFIKNAANLMKKPVACKYLTQNQQLYHFSSANQVQQAKGQSSESLQKQQVKTWVAPEQKNENSLFKPNKPIKFVNGRCLVYMNRQNLSTPFLITSHLTGPMVYLYFLIKHNPFYLTFPAALPLMMFAEFGLLMKYLLHKSHYKYHVERIYLYEDGMHAEFIFANKIRTALKGRQKKIVHPLAVLQTPVQDQNRMPMKGLQFPQSADQIVYPSRIRYAWTKYISNMTNYMIPARFEFIDWDLIIPMMNGNIINVSECTKEGQFQFQQPTIEEQEDRLQQAIKKIKDGMQASEQLDSDKK